MSRAIPAGVYVPSIIFIENDKIDTEAYYRHVQFLAKAGTAGLVVSGTNGEAALLTREERILVAQTARRAIDDLKLDYFYPMIVGVGAQSTAQVTEYAADAKKVGGDFILVLPCSFFAGPAGTPAVIVDFYQTVADRSALPVVIYNYPGVTAGVDLDSDVISTLAAHPNIVGVKLTCGNVGKITRLTSTFEPSHFAVYGGSSDYLVPAMQGKAVGCVTALGNIFPRAIVHLYNLYKSGQFKEAVEFQGKIANAERVCKKGIAMTKYATSKFVGYPKSSVAMKHPYRSIDASQEKWVEQVMEEMSTINENLPK